MSTLFKKIGETEVYLDDEGVFWGATMATVGEGGIHQEEGWGKFTNSQKWHYIKADGRSLCGKYLAWGILPVEQGNDHPSDNCKECVRRHDKETGYVG